MGVCDGRRSRAGGPAGGAVGGVVSTTVPREGGVGPKKRHLVLYKLAGFRHADKTPLTPFFRGRMRHTKFQKSAKNAHFCTFSGSGPPQKCYFSTIFDQKCAFFAPGGTGHFWPNPAPRDAGSLAKTRRPPSRTKSHFVRIF